MKKLELKLDALRVESFEVGPKVAERGTVVGHQLAVGNLLRTANTCLVCVQVATLVYSCECKSADGICDSNETCVSCALVC